MIDIGKRKKTSIHFVTLNTNRHQKWVIKRNLSLDTAELIHISSIIVVA